MGEFQMIPLPLAAGVFEGTTASQMVMLAVGVVGLLVLLGSTRRRVRRSQRSSDVSVRERYADLQHEASSSRDVETVMRELDQLSRQIHGRLDTKLAKLEAVIRDADERIDRLSRMARAGNGAGAVDVTLDPEDPPAATPRGSESEDSPHASVYQLADGGRSSIEIAETLGRATGEVELILSLRKTKQQSGYPAVSTRPLQPTPST